MSSFRQLMMRKKEEIMYATIKGSLTNTDGVISGFSSANYLLGQTNITSEMQQQYLQSFEFQTKITISTITQETQILYFPYRGILSGITLRSNGAIRWYVISSNYNIISTSLFANGDTVYIKGKISNGIATLYSSIDGTNWITEGSVTLGTLEATDVNIPIRLGKSGTASSAGFEGSIDLNNSYIKLGSTKYKLQAVVGYTVVGSPTITDGVVSGLTASNYLQSAVTCDFSQVTNYEVVVKCKLTSSSDSGLICLGTGGSNSWRIWINSGNSLNFSTSYHSERMTISGNFVNNDYYIRVKYNNGTVFLGYSLDNVNYTETSKTFTNLSTANAKINIGYVSNYGIVWNGSINLNETYIKINNKLWFNGQQA